MFLGCRQPHNPEIFVVVFSCFAVCHLEQSQVLIINGCRQSSTCKKSIIIVIYCAAFETKSLFSLALTGSIKYRNGYISEGKKSHHDVNIKDHIDPKLIKMFCANVLLKLKDFLSPDIVLEVIL